MNTSSQDQSPTTSVALDWSEVADEVVTVIQARLEPIARKAADDLYADLLYSAQDYFADNVRFNIASKVEAAERQARYDRARAIKAETINADLLGVAKLALRVDDEWKTLSIDERTRVEAAIAKAEGRCPYCRDTGPEGCGICNETGLAPSSATQVSGQVPGMNTEPQLSTGEQP